MPISARAHTREVLQDLLAQRLLILDGAMGTMVQAHHLDEAQFRGERFRDHPKPVRGCIDLLVLTQPEIVRAIHGQYLEAGADISETNTFTATGVSLADYGLEAHAFEINRTAAALARAAADEMSERKPDRPRFVAGLTACGMRATVQLAGGPWHG